MKVEPDSVHFRILDRLCTMPRPVKGVSGPMLEKEFQAPQALAELARAGLVRERNWDKGPPGGVWVPTAAGEALYARLAGTVEPDRPAKRARR
ncbi:MAG: hypothetical protein HY521_13135 [Proteobacteria bacterium]|nr:hypothetical protein [Pseudomonadota bacterium]